MASVPVVAPPPGNPRFPLLDAVRALAVLSVLLYHTGGASHFDVDNPLGIYAARGDVGVAVFFLLSGFLLYRPFVAARVQGRPPIRVRDYARRRALRILPAWWAALIVLEITIGLPHWDQYWWRFFTFTQNLWGDSVIAGIGAGWSLCVEVSFYLALPLLAAALARLTRRRSAAGAVRVELAALAAIALASVALRAVVVATDIPGIVNSTLPAFLDWFCAGMALAVVSVAWEGREHASSVLSLVDRRPWLPWALAAVAFWVVATRLGLGPGLLPRWTTASYVGQHELYALVAVLVLAPAVFGTPGRGWPRRLLASRALASLGLVSYGVFLYHAPISAQLAPHRLSASWLPGSRYASLSLATLAAAAAVATASYLLLERPLLRLKDVPSGSSRARRRSAARASAGT